MNVTPFEACQKYIAIKLHFGTDKYDYFKCKGQTKITKQAFEKRPDKYWFKKISLKFTQEEFENYLFANFLENDSVWIADLFEESAKRNYLNWKQRIQSLKYTFKEDILKLIDSGINFNEILNIKNGQHSILLNNVLGKNISIETFIILNLLFDLFSRYDKSILETLVWPDFRRKCEKYQPYVAKKIRLGEYKKILKDCLEIF